MEQSADRVAVSMNKDGNGMIAELLKVPVAIGLGAVIITVGMSGMFLIYLLTREADARREEQAQIKKLRDLSPQVWDN